ncbi:MAG: sulfite oxidase [Hyphomicrobiaceae bacterium]|nr:sulfite oxidase [Hyphomicrobiaceae bacterium]
MALGGNPFLHPEKRPHVEGDFKREEVALANRNSGLPLEALRHDLTPVGLHYLLVHFDIPYVASADAWTVRVGGRVSTPLEVSLAEIARLPQRTLRVTIECAGNGRARLNPRSQSQPWEDGAVGTAEWTGAPLRHLLERAGMAADTIEIAFLGADRGFDVGIEHDYGRSLAPDLAMSDDVLLVHAMNGRPLLPQHGFPLRLIVPGWYGMASVKWLSRIEVLDRPFDGFQQVGTYIYRRQRDDAGVPVTHMRVKSLMVPPGIPDWYTRRRLLEHGPVELRGRAWSGGGVPVANVEVGVDGEWQEATLDPDAGNYAWRGWRFTWDATPGEHELVCRATDAAGQVQPLEAPWDSGGFGNNAVHRVAVTVR